MAPRPGSHLQLEVIIARRKQIVAMTEEGLYAREIARELNISTRTVQRHQSHHRRGIAPRRSGPQVSDSS